MLPAAKRARDRASDVERGKWKFVRNLRRHEIGNPGTIKKPESALPASQDCDEPDYAARKGGGFQTRTTVVPMARLGSRPSRAAWHDPPRVFFGQ